jgi:glycosyltransferase involved in cell wall biosynthesis
MVARFEFWKGHIFAIEAFRKLLKEYPNVRLLIFGSKGESFDSVIRYIKSYDLQDYIMYKGFVSDNIALFRLFDVHIHIPIKSISETFGINIVEGMISGCAQILTLAGISCFTARNEENCLVVPYTSSNAVYFALKRMINDPELRARLGKQAQLDAIKYFKYSDKVEKHLELYESLRRELGK